MTLPVDENDLKKVSKSISKLLWRLTGLLLNVSPFFRLALTTIRAKPCKTCFLGTE